MPIEVRAPNRGRAVNGKKRPDNRLSYTDQAMFLGLRATGQDALMQGVWLYEHAVDIDGLRRFHRNFGYGLYGRLIERSPLPFGRHRWVSSVGPSTQLDVGEQARPRVEVTDWLDERAALPIDPENGPTWHLGAQRFTDGLTAVCLTGTHCIGDGAGALLTILEAINGNRRDLGYPPPRSRTRPGALLADATETVRSAPEVVRSLAAAARLAVRRRTEITRAKPPRPSAAADNRRGVAQPSVVIFVGTRDWDARAESLGGNPYSLVAGFAAKVAEHIGRRRAEDGAVALILPISDRSPEDTRANAVSLANLTVDPTSVTADLSGVRIAVKEAIRSSRDEPDEALQLLPLIPFVPRRAVARGANALFGFADLPVSCSNIGQLPAEITCVDGTPAEYHFQRGIEHNATRAVLEQRHGLLTVISGRVPDKVSIEVIGYQPDATDFRARLREVAERTLGEFDLVGTVI